MTGVTRIAPPRADAMLEALRGLGYSTSAALADIIDNSISAGAAEIHVDFEWSGTNSRISVTDNGRGMNDPELERAMRLGAISPLETRATGDMGRFGMGLKTASFSQCRRLTVASRREGQTACLRWDLDALSAHPEGGWLLFEGPAPGSESHVSSLGNLQSGTMVIWESLDRIVTAGFSSDDFNDLIDRVEPHLAMVFHRILESPHPRIRIILNGRPVVPWDPFMKGHPAKPWESPVEKKATNSGLIGIQCHVLPHKDKLSAEEFKRAAGPEGWTAQQGLYVYRNRRLLVSGGWLGLGQGGWNREEAHRLARIQLDIPNTADSDWKIDIRKSTARPPVALRGWLTMLSEDTRERARRVFAFRGAPGRSPQGAPVEQAWIADRGANGIRYRIDEKSSVVAAVLESAGERAPLVRAMLRVIEETVPVQRIWLDTAETKETPRTGFSGEAPGNVVEVLKTLFSDMVVRRKMSPEAARQTLLGVEPFQNYPNLVASLQVAD